MPENIMVNGFNINGNPIPYNYDSLGNKLEKTSIAREYSNVDTYNVDEYVIYNGKMYKCKQKILVGESFDSTKWDECSVGPELNYIKKFMTFSDDAKQALLNCFSHVAWVDEHGQDYYDVLEAALYHPVDLLSISVVFEQGETVIYDTNSLDDLKPMLTVTAHYANDTSAEITTYALSGTLTVGTSTITVSYGGKTTTFDVTVSAPAFLYELSESDFSRGLANDVIYNSTPPYTKANTKRISYVDFDLLFDGGKTYEIIATSTKDTANMGIQFFNAALLDDVANHNDIGTANTLDTGWQNLSVTYAVPATHNNSAIKGCRITFRESSANPKISSDFKIAKLTIREVTA